MVSIDSSTSQAEYQKVSLSVSSLRLSSDPMDRLVPALGGSLACLRVSHALTGVADLLMIKRGIPQIFRGRGDQCDKDCPASGGTFKVTKPAVVIQTGCVKQKFSSDKPVNISLVRVGDAGWIHTGIMGQVPPFSSADNLELQGTCYIREIAVSEYGGR